MPTGARVSLAAGLLALAVTLGPGVHPAEAAEACLSETYRPQYHFSPRKHWINDPNGLVYNKGIWHMFYQYSPSASVPNGDISWGHAVSKDLIHWEELEVAIPADNATSENIYSGSAVVDTDNTAGFGKGALICIYTSDNTSSGIQAQSIAYSLDNGLTFTKYENNPVLDENMTEFRDPSVQWYAPGGYWVMAVSLSDDRQVRFYKSENLTSWERMSEFGPAGHWNVSGLQYECPDLFRLPVEGHPELGVKWILIVNINPGAPQGGSAGQYFIGDFNGTAFTADDNETRWLDYGKDNYAAITWKRAPDDNVYLIGWMSNWQYSKVTPTTVWRNAMTLPRRLSLKLIDSKLVLTQTPVDSVFSLQKRRSSFLSLLARPPTSRHTITLVNETVDVTSSLRGGRSPRDIRIKGLSGEAYHLSVTLTDPTSAKRQGIKVRVGDDQYTSIVYDAENQTLKVDRNNSGEVDFDTTNFPGEHGGAVELRNGKLSLDVFVDWSSVEVFANDGEMVITETIFPNSTSDGVLLFVEEGRGEFTGLRLTELRSYRQCE